LFYDNSHRDLIADLTTQIHRWQARTGDTLKV